MSGFLIIGAGSAGNVIARRLLDAGFTVTLVEAGTPAHANPDIRKVYDLGKIWHSPQDWDYRTVPQENAAGRRMHIPRGKVVGGSHALNATIWVRGHRKDFDTWEYLGCPGWGWNDVLPYFQQIEHHVGATHPVARDPQSWAALPGGPAAAGTDGCLDVTEDYPHSPIQDAAYTAAVQAGHPATADYNSGETEGVGYMQLNVRDGDRFNTWNSYLEPVADHLGLTLVTDAQVVRLVFAETADASVGTRVTGVIVREMSGELREITADTTVLAAGAFGSPEILLRSGIGPATELAEAGVESRVDLPGVGKNLQDHLLAPVIFEAAKEIPAPRVTVTEVHLFAKSDPALAVPDTQPMVFSIPMPSDAYPHGEMAVPANGFTLMGAVIRPASVGSVTLAGPDADDGIAINTRALSADADARALVQSVKDVREIGQQTALADDWGAREVWPGPDVVTDEQLDTYVRETCVTYHHVAGTCKMGADEAAVVDPQTFAVRGVAGLHIADASIMPMVPSGNTNAPTIMIAERAAEYLAQR